MPARVELLLASSNAGKLREYQLLAASQRLELAQVPRFDSLPRFDEAAPTLAENAAGKALHYSRFASAPVIADDSGLFVAALGGAPGAFSARYAGGGASDATRIQKLLEGLRGTAPEERGARFVCVLALAAQGRLLGVFSDSVAGLILDSPCGKEGFGYDPVFYFPPVGKAFAELPREQKNQVSHRGRAFRKMAEFLKETR